MTNGNDSAGSGKPSGASMDLGWLDLEGLNRFPTILPLTAEIPAHQLGWRMAVMPFRSLGASLGYGIALGMAEEISAALSRFRTPRLVAPATFWDGSGPAIDAMGRCRAYRLDYIIDGTIEVIGDQARVTVTLLDVVLDFEVIWSGRFSASMRDLFTLQNEIANTTIAQIDPELFARGNAGAAPAKTEIAEAHHLVLGAIQGIFRLDRQRFMRGRELLNQAIALDPRFASAYAWLAYWNIIAVGMGWVAEPREVTLSAGTSAEQAIALDPLDARALAIAGHVRGYLQHDVQTALSMHAKAIELNPNLPIAWTVSSWSKIYNGEHSTAIRHATTAQSLSPRDPHIFFSEHALMTAEFFLHNLERAERIAEVVLDRHPGHISALNVSLAIYGHMGRKDDASLCLASLLSIEPRISIAKIVSRAPIRPQDRDYYITGLRRAGVPED